MRQDTRIKQGHKDKRANYLQLDKQKEWFKLQKLFINQ